MDLLKRQLAPILPDAWSRIDEEAKRVLTLHLGGRKVVDFAGPHGWKLAAVSTGRLAMHDATPIEGVSSGVRRVQPLVEVRTPIKLEIMELDSVARGADDPDLDPVIDAAERVARVEDRAIFHGWKDAGITGMIEASPHKPIVVASSAAYPRAILEGKDKLRAAGIGGPYALVLGVRAYEDLYSAAEDGYPIIKRIDKAIIDGPIVRSPAIDGAVIVSVRGGDYELTVGQDLSIGYADRDRTHVELFLTETFTFRVLEPAAALHLKHA